MVDARQAAALAEIGAQTVALGLPDLEIYVRHLGSDLVVPTLELDLPVAEIGTFDETLAFASGGVSSEVFTRFSSSLNGDLTGEFKPVDPGLLPVGLRGNRPSYAGAAFGSTRVHNPSFLYDARHSVEVLLTLDSKSTPTTFGDSIVLAESVEAMCRAAAQVANAPILFLQTPVAPHNDPTGRYRTDGSGEQPRFGQAFAARMAVGLEDAQPAERIAMLRALEQFCQIRGIGLQISDPRLGRVRGEWWSVCSPNARLFVEKRDELCLEVADRSLSPMGFKYADQIGEVHLVTAIGPARPGSSLALVSDLFRRNVGIVAASVAALQETAVINFVVPVAAALEGVPFSSSALSARSGLNEVAHIAALTPQSGAKRSQGELSKALDYQVVRSGPFQLPTVDRIDGNLAVWLSWELVGRGNANDPALIAADFFRKDVLVRECGVVYERVRWVASAGRTRGRAKLSVALKRQMAAASVAVWLSKVCEKAEAAVEREAAERNPDLLTALRIGWRERWLGGWPAGVPL